LGGGLGLTGDYKKDEGEKKWRIPKKPDHCDHHSDSRKELIRKKVYAIGGG